MTKFAYQMAAEFAVDAKNRDAVSALVDKMKKLDPDTAGQTSFSGDFDAAKTTLTLSLHSASEEAQRKALLVYGPILGELAEKATRRRLDCSDNAPMALRAALVPMQATFIALP